MPLRFASKSRDLERQRIALAQDNRMWPVTMKEIPRAEWPEVFSHTVNATATRVWRSQFFIVVLWVEPGKDALRLSVQRARLNDAGQIDDGISWDDLMRVKSECGFGDQDAVELYPRDVDVVNVANMRHLWILPTLSDLAWRDAQGGQ